MTFDRMTKLLRFTNGVCYYHEFRVEPNFGFPPGIGNRIDFVLSILKLQQRDMNFISDAVILLMVAQTYRGTGHCDHQAVDSMLKSNRFMKGANAKFDTQLRSSTTFARCGFDCPVDGAHAHDHWEHWVLRIHHQEWVVDLADSALHAERERVLVDLAESAPRAEPEHEQDDRSSATSSDSDPDEEPHAESPPATQAPQAADAGPSAPDFADFIEQWNAQVKGVLAIAQASADDASAAAIRAELARGKAELAQERAELARGKAELAQEEAANPRAKRILDFEADQASAGSQSSKASRPSLCTRSSVARS